MGFLRHTLRDDCEVDPSGSNQAQALLSRDDLAARRDHARNFYEIGARHARRLHCVLRCDALLLVTANAGRKEHAAWNEYERSSSGLVNLLGAGRSGSWHGCRWKIGGSPQKAQSGLMRGNTCDSCCLAGTSTDAIRLAG